MRPINVKIPEAADLGQTADLHDVVAFVELATIGLRHAEFEPTWYADVTDVVSYYAIDEIPPWVGGKPTAFTPDAILEIVMFVSGWNTQAATDRETHAKMEYPPLCQ